MKNFLWIAALLFVTHATFGQKNATDTTARVLDTISTRTIFSDEIIVTGTRAKENAPTTFTTVSKETLGKINLGQDLPVLLDATPSVVSTSDAGAGVGYTGIRIRGSDATRINVTINGIPVNDAESQGTFWVNMPDFTSSVQDIQIQRGVGTSTNGSGAFGASINIRTQQHSQKAFGELSTSYGSFNTWKHTVKAGTGMIKDRFYIEGRISKISSDGYVERAKSNLWSYYISTGYQYKNTILKYVHFSGREKTYQAWYGVPQDSLAVHRKMNIAGTDYYANSPAWKDQNDNYRQDYHQLFFTQKLSNSWVLNLAGFATLGKGFYEEFKVDQSFAKYKVDAPVLNGDTLLRGDLVRRRWLDNGFYGGTYSVNYEGRKGLSVSVGGLAAYYDGDHYGTVLWARNAAVNNDTKYYFNVGRKTDINVYAKLNYEWNKKLIVFADLQYRYVKHTMKGDENGGYSFDIQRNWNFFNPKVGIAYQAHKYHQVYASFAMGNREPNRDDIVDGNIQKNETMYNAEAGYRFANSKYAFSANYYMMYYKNQLVLTGRLNDVGNPIKANAPSSYRTGVELQGSLQPVKYFRATGNFTFSVNKIKSFKEYIYTYDENYEADSALTLIIDHKNSDISFSPSIISALTLTALPVTGLEVSLVTKAVSKQYMDNSMDEERKLKPFWYSNINVQYTLKTSFLKEIQFNLLLNNVFNKLYESNGFTYSERYSYLDENSATQVTPVSKYNSYYPQAGFNFLLGITIKL